MPLVTRSFWRDLSGLTLASVAATLTDAGLYAALLHLAPPHPWRVGGCATCAAIAGGVLHFCLCRFIVFRIHHAPIARAALRYTAMSATGAFGHGLITQGVSLLVHPSLAWIISKLIIYLGWTLPLSRHVVFVAAPSATHQEPPA